ncbi:TolC family protein, partial [Herbaspirillum sp. HC18]
MQYTLRACALAAALMLSAMPPAAVAEPVLGASVESLLEYALERNPEYATMRHEADAARARSTSAGALPDPKLRIELMDITKMGEQSPTLSPSRVGQTKYTIMQELPWFGKRDLQREAAAFEAEGATGKA